MYCIAIWLQSARVLLARILRKSDIQFFVPGLRVILCRLREDAVISSGKCKLWLRIEAVV
ncbi:hypothetical protein APHWI1_1114 [Anaplasma phagocytophilum str. ApWI1]|uniref:Uncharacterized protein n=2 Tax=Anaplasma phagocytophilum TaxID=948 RepID=A0A0F3NKE8_ANAPH|nr:hypothetical protein [Anaplasma phagocytophilum]AGR79198.1 hypothetical protein YYU_00575 [Anaplasma phagocytophilum str. HZ2]KJV68538.1 hypothetical protein EPHNCH_0326 [Anaplasma phagocytophilum str. NCH-1]KJV83344.1 hypothetical protein APHHGE2_0340 [Anaplasma phagocytophilum str. HGE2]KJV85077.1 hypothetical protein APHWI1_1114 [Anaplasma phagocytophilum str. ApWI1]